MSEHLAPPWKAAHIRSLWYVTTDRGDPRDEYDVNEDPPEWAVRLEAAAPELLAACEEIIRTAKITADADRSKVEAQAIAKVLVAIALAKGGPP